MDKNKKQKIIEDFVKEEAATTNVDSVIKIIYELLNNNKIKYSKPLVRKRLIKISMYYNVEKDISEIIKYLLYQVKFNPTNLDHFWGYIVRTCQYPPFEDNKHLKDRKGKKRLDGKEWAFLMKIKRKPETIKQKPPEWLDFVLTYNTDFAKVYERYIREAKDKMGSLDTTKIKDEKYMNLGEHKSLMDIDLKKILEEIEGS